MASDTRAEAERSVQFHTRTYASEHREALERDHWGRSALMRDGEVIAIYDAGIDAYDAGMERFGQGNFATQGIGTVSVGYRVVQTID
ncbi:MAG: hypothetical protein F4Y99_03395 [Acidimicrobiaceae bacterium]|nr:hypothetical protein [Acidimicrobiaceae bacterium]MXZ94953.1 hypothetical protein [Acidimicrobiaceae bacterium]MYF42339.1 hypothetical protein [Acidimicrobiaceae bacterium]